MGKISGLPTDSAPTATDYIIVNDSETGITKRVLLSDLASILVPNMALANNPYTFSAYGPDVSLTANTWTKATMNTKVLDPSNSFSTANSRWVAPVAGDYAILAQVGVSTSGISTGYGQGALWINGAEVISGHRQVGSGNANTIPKSALNKVFYLNVGDYVEAYGYCSEGSRSIAGGAVNTYLSGFLIAKR